MKSTIPYASALLMLFATQSYANGNITDPIKSCAEDITPIKVPEDNTVLVPREHFNNFITCIDSNVKNNYRKTENPDLTQTEIDNFDVIENKIFKFKANEDEKEFYRKNYLKLSSRIFIGIKENPEDHFENKDIDKGELYSFDVRRASFYEKQYLRTPIAKVVNNMSKITYVVVPSYPGICDEYPKESDKYKYCTGEKSYKESHLFCENSYGDPCGTEYDKTRGGYIKKD